jgi:hypothetical protein
MNFDQFGELSSLQTSFQLPLENNQSRIIGTTIHTLIHSIKIAIL